MSKWADEQAFERGLDVGTEDSSPLRGTWPEYVAKAWSDDAFPKGKCILIGRRILDLEAELAAMRPVVEAAEAWREDASLCDMRLFEAVDAYRAQREGK